jgi:hypothetical protein
MREVAPLPPVESPGPPSLVNAVVAFMIAVSLVATWAVLCRSEATERDSVANFLGEHATPLDMTGLRPHRRPAGWPSSSDASAPASAGLGKDIVPSGLAGARWPRKRRSKGRVA